MHPSHEIEVRLPSPLGPRPPAAARAAPRALPAAATPRRAAPRHATPDATPPSTLTRACCGCCAAGHGTVRAIASMRRGVAWRGAARRGAARHGVAWRGVAWRGVTRARVRVHPPDPPGPAWICSPPKLDAAEHCAHLRPAPCVGRRSFLKAASRSSLARPLTTAPPPVARASRVPSGGRPLHVDPRGLAAAALPALRSDAARGARALHGADLAHLDEDWTLVRNREGERVCASESESEREWARGTARETESGRAREHARRPAGRAASGKPSGHT
jgi:hypothetical protein